MNIRILFLALAFVWMLQLVLSLLQTKRFHKEVAELRKTGAMTSVGVSGRNWTLKVYGVLVVDQARTIVRAQRLSGFTVFAGLKDVPTLVGTRLERLEQQTPVAGVSKKLWAAFQNAAGFINRHDQRLAEEADEQEAEADVAGLATE